MPTSSTEQFIFADPTYSLHDAIQNSVAAEAEFGYTDVGPVDTLAPEVLEAHYRLFYGSSPLSSLSPSPQPSRSASPTISFNTLNDTHFNMHSPSPPPPTHSTSSALNPSTETLQNDETHGANGNSRTRRNKKKGHANRSRKRKEARAQQDGNAIPYPNWKKHIERADTVSTAYDTNDIPSASSGFIALPDRGDGHSKVHELRELLEGEQIRLIRWNGMCVPPYLS